MLNSSYHNPLAFNEEIFGQSERALERLRSALRPALPGSVGLSLELMQSLAGQVDITRTKFIECMDDDFNTAGAMGVLFDLVRVINQARADGASVDSELQHAQQLVKELTGVLGLQLEDSQSANQQAAPFVQLLVDLTHRITQKQTVCPGGILSGNQLGGLGVIVED